MRKTDYLRLSIIFLLSFVLIANQSEAGSKRRERQKQVVEERREQQKASGLAVFGLKGGYFGSGKIRFEGSEFDTKSGQTYGAFMDFRVGSKTMMSLMLDLGEVSHRSYDTKWLINVGVGYKGNFPVSQKGMYFRPALAIGAAFLNDFAVIDDSYYLTIRTYCELLQQIKKRWGILMEFGAICSPYGTDGESDISAYPRIFFRLGVVFK